MKAWRRIQTRLGPVCVQVDSIWAEIARSEREESRPDSTKQAQQTRAASAISDEPMRLQQEEKAEQSAEKKLRQALVRLEVSRLLRRPVSYSLLVLPLR